jgi:hypothetical protein
VDRFAIDSSAGRFERRLRLRWSGSALSGTFNLGAEKNGALNLANMVQFQLGVNLMSDGRHHRRRDVWTTLDLIIGNVGDGSERLALPRRRRERERGREGEGEGEGGCRCGRRHKRQLEESYLIETTSASMHGARLWG